MPRSRLPPSRCEWASWLPDEGYTAEGFGPPPNTTPTARGSGLVQPPDPLHLFQHLHHRRVLPGTSLRATKFTSLLAGALLETKPRQLIDLRQQNPPGLRVSVRLPRCHHSRDTTTNPGLQSLSARNRLTIRSVSSSAWRRSRGTDRGKTDGGSTFKNARTRCTVPSRSSTMSS